MIIINSIWPVKSIIDCIAATAINGRRYLSFLASTKHLPKTSWWKPGSKFCAHCSHIIVNEIFQNFYLAQTKSILEGALDCWFLSFKIQLAFKLMQCSSKVFSETGSSILQIFTRNRLSSPETPSKTKNTWFNSIQVEYL